MRFHKVYFIVSIALFSIEVGIATFFSGGFIRNVLGDFLIVFLLYFFILSFLKIKKQKLAFIVLIFAYGIELLQYVTILKLLKFERSVTSDLILGSSFDWNDILAYTLAFLCLQMWIKIIQKRHRSSVSE